MADRPTDVQESDVCPGCGASPRGLACDCWDCPRCKQTIPGSVVCGCWDPLAIPCPACGTEEFEPCNLPSPDGPREVCADRAEAALRG